MLSQLDALWKTAGGLKTINMTAAEGDPPLKLFERYDTKGSARVSHAPVL
jgi:hypothetical protein